MLIRYAGMRYPQRLAAMRINFGTNDGELAPTAVRYDVAWCVIQPEFRAQSKKICWWLDSSFPIEAAAAARLKELQGPLTQNNGNLAIYEVQHDNTNRIVSERIVARTGGERPPFRCDVQPPGLQLKAAFDELVRPHVRKAPRKAQSRVGLTLAIAAGFSCAIGLAVFFAGTNIRDAADRTHASQVAEAERQRTEPGRILVPRGNSMCDKLLFDNQAGGVKVEGAVRCVPEPSKPQAATFTSTWPGNKK